MEEFHASAAAGSATHRRGEARPEEPQGVSVERSVRRRRLSMRPVPAVHERGSSRGKDLPVIVAIAITAQCLVIYGCCGPSRM